MSFAALLENLSAYSRFPIPVDDVLEWLKQHGICDEIAVYPVDIDSRYARGRACQFYRHDKPYGRPIRCMEILVSTNMSLSWQRLVACKEALHIFDKPAERAQTKDAIDRLVSEVVVDGYNKDDSLQAFSDKLVELKALAALAPIHIVRELRPRYDSEDLSAKEIGDYFGVPTEKVPGVMSRHFESLWQVIAK